MFIILPDFPVDGGHILRFTLLHRIDTSVKAINTVAIVGHFLRRRFIGFGLFQLARGNFLGALGFVLIGWFLTNDTYTRWRDVTPPEALRDVLVQEVMDPNPKTVIPNTSMQKLALALWSQSIGLKNFLGFGLNRKVYCYGNRIVPPSNVKIPRSRIFVDATFDMSSTATKKAVIVSRCLYVLGFSIFSGITFLLFT